MKKSRIAAFAGAIAIVLVALVPLSAQAVKPTIHLIESDGVTREPTQRWIDENGYIRLPKAELEGLAGTQTPKQIEALVRQGGPLNLLIDPNTGEYLAAAVASKAPGIVTPNAITLGCGGTGNAQSSRYYGGGALATCYQGTGSIYVNLPNTFYLSAGRYATSFLNPQGPTLYVGAYQSGTLSSTITVTRVIR